MNSRYYSPEFGRFISADVFISTGQGLQGANMFAYCGNNPVMGYDPSGMYWRNQLFLYYAGAYYIELLDGFREDELHELMRR